MKVKFMKTKLQDDFNRHSILEEMYWAFKGRILNPRLNRARSSWFLIGVATSVIALHFLDLLRT